MSRPNPHRRGYTRRWKKARAGFLARNPWCVPCRRAGRVTPAMLIHHRAPHRGDKRLFWDTSTWEGRCTTCHADAQKVEQAHSSRAETYRGCGPDGSPLDPKHHWNGGKARHVPRFSRSYIPENVPPIGDRLTVVCGPPRAGKTTWVQEQAQPGDIVVDLDAFEGTIDERYEQRDRMLTDASRTGSAVWLIIGAPLKGQRERIRSTLHPGRVVVLETPAHVCMERALGDPRPGIREAIARWCRQYEPSEYDERVELVSANA